MREDSRWLYVHHEKFIIKDYVQNNERMNKKQKYAEECMNE